MRLCFCFCILFPVVNSAQDSQSEYKLKSVFIFNFTRFVDWPASSFTSETSPFIIGVSGKNPFNNYLEQTVSGEMVGKHPIQIKYIPDINQAGGCHLLFISSNEISKVKEFINSNLQSPTLTVSDMPEFNVIGGMIRFFYDNNKIRFEINTAPVKQANLNISSKLLSVAKTN